MNLAVRVTYSESKDYVYIKSNAKNRDVDINPCLSRNEPSLHVTEFDRAGHNYVCVTNEKESLREKFKPCSLSHLLTACQSQRGAVGFSVLESHRNLQ